MVLARECEEAGQPTPKLQCAELSRQELEAQANLAKLLFDMGEREVIPAVLDSSAGLLDLAPTSGDGTPRLLAFNWAELCGLWAMMAYKVKLFPRSERGFS